MLPFFYLLLTTIIILVTGFIVWKLSIFHSGNVIVFAWLWFNLFIALYEFYVIYHRRHMAKQDCPQDFWGTPVSGDFWLKAWLEYTCYSDKRYLDPNDTVFYIEGFNAILVVLMWVAILMGSYPLLMYLLIIQAANCLLYFVSLYVSRKISLASPKKLALYLLMSSMWFFVPLYIIMIYICVFQGRK